MLARSGCRVLPLRSLTALPCALAVESYASFMQAVADHVTIVAQFAPPDGDPQFTAEVRVMPIPDTDPWTAAFLASEPDYDESAWIDAYVIAIGLCKPELTADEAARLAREAYSSQGWTNPTVCAGVDAVLGRMRTL